MTSQPDTTAEDVHADADTDAGSFVIDAAFDDPVPPATTKRPNLDFVTERLATGGDLHPVEEVARTDLEAMLELGITHIVDTRMEWSDEDFVAEHAPEVTYVHLGVDDAGQRLPDEWFDRGIGAAVGALALPDTRVLVHCHMGINRGPSLAFAVLLHQGLPVTDALAAIRTARPIAAIGYAHDALRHHHVANDVPFDVREENWATLDRWMSENRIDVERIIRGIRAEEGTIFKSMGG
ncbi:MAG: dual specificity protein phosphatase family protein [Acidimicrobiia bacterium]|nr:dual specificity protein phosphatase family protein [Acidimicrobiia bacterium]